MTRQKKELMKKIDKMEMELEMEISVERDRSSKGQAPGLDRCQGCDERAVRLRRRG